MTDEHIKLLYRREEEEQEKIDQLCEGQETEEGFQSRCRQDQAAAVEDQSERSGPVQAALSVLRRGQTRHAAQQGAQVLQTRVNFTQVFVSMNKDLMRMS